MKPPTVIKLPSIMELPSVLRWYQFLRARHHFSMFESVRCALWLAADPRSTRPWSWSSQKALLRVSLSRLAEYRNPCASQRIGGGGQFSLRCRTASTRDRTHARG